MPHKLKLRRMTFISLVERGANQEADITLFKGRPVQTPTSAELDPQLTAARMARQAETDFASRVKAEDQNFGGFGWLTREVARTRKEFPKMSADAALEVAKRFCSQRQQASATLPNDTEVAKMGPLHEIEKAVARGEPVLNDTGQLVVKGMPVLKSDIEAHVRAKADRYFRPPDSIDRREIAKARTRSLVQAESECLDPYSDPSPRNPTWGDVMKRAPENTAQSAEIMKWTTHKEAALGALARIGREILGNPDASPEKAISAAMMTKQAAYKSDVARLYNDYNTAQFKITNLMRTQ